MDQIKELEKYKILYDEGAISEEEFSKLKQDLLGLKSDQDKEIEKQREREKALAEIRKLREEESAKKEEQERARAEQAKAEKARAEQAKAEKAKAEQERIRQERAKEEKARQEIRAKEEKARQEIREKEERELQQKKLEEERARQEAMHEYEMKQKAEQIARAQQSVKSATNIVAKIILWVLTVLCTLVGIVSILPSYSKSPVFDILTALIFLIFGIMACPPITAKMKENDKLAAFCKYKIVVVILLLILWFVLAGVLLA